MIPGGSQRWLLGFPEPALEVGGKTIELNNGGWCSNMNTVTMLDDTGGYLFWLVTYGMLKTSQLSSVI